MFRYVIRVEAPAEAWTAAHKSQDASCNGFTPIPGISLYERASSICTSVCLPVSLQLSICMCVLFLLDLSENLF